MPKRLLPVRHQRQEEASGCLAACAQMVLSHQGIDTAQNALNRLFDLRDAGARYTHLHRLTRYGVQVSLLSGDERNLRLSLDQGAPLIIFVLTGELKSYWQTNVRHAVVVIGYDEHHFYLNDPAFPDAPKQVPIDELMLAWLEFDYTYAVITR
jgi:ABC-type bacteriocin/lantibiotic exporter with double-glycine peptidase domain